MTTAVYWHSDALAHETPPGHPEQVARAEVVRRVLKQDQFASLAWPDVPIGARDDVLRCHDAAYVTRVEAASPVEGWASLDADTHLSPGSVTAAYRAVGGCVAAVDAVMAGDVGNAFVAMRPPGHHAEHATPMGFCLFGNVAIAAKHALDHHQLSRVAVLDFDVHHGNGTQDLLWEEPRALFASSHQIPLWPGSGAAHEVGPHSNIMNAPLAPMTGGTEMRRAWEREVLPAVDDFEPEMILISAGFDAHRADPLANLNWEVEDFVWLTQAICDVADNRAGGRVVSTLEGGYDLDALAASVAAHVRVLMERGA